MTQLPAELVSIMTVPRSWRERLFSWPWRPWQGRKWREFKPGAHFNKDLRLTTLLTKDAPIVWHPHGPAELGHFLDLGYDLQTGKLVGVQVWDDVLNRKRS